MADGPRRTDEAARLVAAAPDAVFAAFADPAALAQWLPPAGAAMQVTSFDPRPGGALRFILTFAETVEGKSGANADIVEARIVEYDPPSRIAWDVGFDSDRPEFAGTMRMTWTVTPATNGSEVRVVASNVPTGISAEAHNQGLTSSLDNLARFLTR